MTDTKITKIPCPTCRRETPWKDNPFRPFCSERCRLIDLGAWVAGDYRVAGEKRPVEEDDDE